MQGKLEYGATLLVGLCQYYFDGDSKLVGIASASVQPVFLIGDIIENRPAAQAQQPTT